MRNRAGVLWTAASLAILVGLAGCSGRNRGAGSEGSALDAAILNNNGVMLLEHDRGDVVGALALFQKAVQIKPDYVIGHVNLGIAHFAQSQAEDYRAAVEALNRAEQLGGKFPNLYYARGLCKSKQQDYTGAEQDFRAVLRIDDRDAFTHYWLGKTLFDQAKAEEGIREFETAVKLLPNFESAWYNLGQALIRTGKQDEGMKALDMKERLHQAGTGVVAGSGPYFASNGKYLEPLADTGAPKAFGPATGPMVTFADATGESGLSGTSYRWTPGEQPSFGAAWGDYDNDGKPDLLLAQAKKVTLFHNEDGRLSLIDDSGLRYPGSVFGGCWGDYDNDGNQDVLLYGTAGVRVYQNIQGGKFRDVTTPVRIPAGKKVSHAVWVDYDHEGFLDIFACYVDAPCALYRNNGGIHFADMTAKFLRDAITVKSGKPAFLRLAAAYVLPTDYDRNRAVDFLIVAEDGKHALLRNNYDGTFTDMAAKQGLEQLGPARQIAAGDLNSDGLIDYVAAGDTGVQAVLHRPDNTFTVQTIPSGDSPLKVRSVNLADFDNDGRYDVLAQTYQMTGMSGELELRLYRGNGDGSFTDARTEAGLDRVMTKGGGGVVLADVDGNGFPDFLLPGPRPLLFKNAGNANRWVRLNLRGLKVSPDKEKRKGARTNGGGIGAVVEAWTDSTWQMTEVTASAGNDIQPIMGLGATGNPRWVRILWTSGAHECEPLGEQTSGGPYALEFRQLEATDAKGELVRATHMYLQEDGERYVSRFGKGNIVTEIPIKLNTTWVVWEPDRNPTSCPVLYVWNGREYRFITDLQGGAIVGYNVGKRQYNVTDPDEYVLIPGEAFGRKDGKYSIEIADQLQEVLFIDATHLLAVDHPADTRVFSNDRMLAAPPYPTFQVWSVEKTRPLRAATDDTGANVLPLVAKIDRKYPENFRPLPFQGFAETHSLTLDLGDIRGAKQVLLLLYGWQDYAHSSSNLAAAHAGIYGQPPSVQVKDGKGRWRTVLADMGSVAGLPKWLAVDLTPYVKEPHAKTQRGKDAKNPSKIQNPESQIRIVTNLMLYWDKIEVGLRYRDLPTRLTRLTPDSAEYHWLGYPTPVYPDGRDPVVYDYNRRRRTAPWAIPAGYYTRPGDVTELLQKPDDMYVIMRHGHAIRITFDPSKLPPLPPGWKRDFVLYSDGFGKDMDMNGAHSLTVGPLPFHKMTRYPYGPNERYPTDRAHVEYQAKYNTVYEGGAPAVARWPELHKR